MKKKGWGGHDSSNESENGKDVLRKLKKNAENTGAFGKIKKTDMDPDGKLPPGSDDNRKDGYPKNKSAKK